MTDIKTPDYMPILSKGEHTDPKSGGCFMEIASFLAGEAWSDSPACTHPVIASMARAVNDRLDDSQRQRLVTLIPRVIGTADTRPDELARQVLSVRLAVWCARAVLPLVREADRAVCVRAIEAAQAWTDEPTDKISAAYAAAANAGAAANAANAAASAYASAAAATAYAATAYAASASASAAYAAYADLVGLLTGLLDEHQRLTGHTARDVSADELRHAADLVRT